MSNNDTKQQCDQVENQEIITTEDLQQFMDELSSMAKGLLRQQWSEQSMRPSDLVQSAFRRQGFKGQRLDELTWKNRKHFFGAMYRAMKRALRDHARRRNSEKRQVVEDVVQQRQLHNETPEHLAQIDEDFERRRQWGIFQLGDLQLRDLRRTLDESPEQITALLETMEVLEESDPEGAEVIQHRVYTNLTLAQTAQMMDVSVKTVQRKWNRAWPWLNREVLRKVNEHKDF